MNSIVIIVPTLKSQIVELSMGPWLTGFDVLCAHKHVTKIETVGEEYVCAVGVQPGSQSESIQEALCNLFLATVLDMRIFSLFSFHYDWFFNFPLRIAMERLTVFVGKSM